MTTMASSLRQSRTELQVLLVRQGIDAELVPRELDALVLALEGSDESAAPRNQRREVGAAVLAWGDEQGIGCDARDLRRLHAWVVAGMDARIRELESASASAATVEERLRFILPNARIMVLELDCELRVRWVYDPRGDRHEMLGLNLHEIEELELTEQLSAIVERVVRTGIGERAELSPPNEEGRTEHVLASFEPMRDPGGVISGVLVAATVVTELKEAGIALAQAVAFREQMLAVLAHDLKNPLSSILALSRLHARNEQVPANVRRALSIIDQSSQRMVELIVTLLDFSAARFGRALPITRVACHLDETARAVVEELREASPRHEIDLRIDGDTQGSWDAPRMAQTVSNLVGNALVHGAAGKPVEVLLQGNEQHVILRVRNQGAPICAEVMPTLFEPFRRGGDPEQRPRGLGLGLYIVQEIVKAHGGEVAVESTAERGTCFTVTLPR